MNHSRELRIPRELYELRKKRFAKLFALNAPDIILCAEAELFLRSFKWSWAGWWSAFRLRHFPHWLNWAIDSEYREAWKALADEAADGE